MLYWVHLFLIALVLSIPFWPTQALAYGIYIPAILAVLWLILGGCPLSQAEPELKGKPFTQHMLANVFPDITTKQTDDTLTVALVLITLVGGLRLARDQCVR